MSPLRNETGAALLIAITLTLMLAAVATVVALNARIEITIAANFRQGHEAAFVAKGGLARAIQDLAALADWTPPLSGVRSTFANGAVAGPRQLPGGDLVVLCCGPGTVTDELQQRRNGGRSWGLDTPQWQPYAWGPANDWLPPGQLTSPFFVAVWVADDAEDGDGNPLVDANGAIVVHALSIGPIGARRSVEATIRHSQDADGTPLGRGATIVSTRESRW